jgi:hypothetical protein
MSEELRQIVKHFTVRGAGVLPRAARFATGPNHVAGPAVDGFVLY